MSYDDREDDIRRIHDMQKMLDNAHKESISFRERERTDLESVLRDRDCTISILKNEAIRMTLAYEKLENEINSAKKDEQT